MAVLCWWQGGVSSLVWELFPRSEIQAKGARVPNFLTGVSNYNKGVEICILIIPKLLRSFLVELPEIWIPPVNWTGPDLFLYRSFDNLNYMTLMEGTLQQNFEALVPGRVCTF